MNKECFFNKVADTAKKIREDLKVMRTDIFDTDGKLIFSKDELTKNLTALEELIEAAEKNVINYQS